MSTFRQAQLVLMNGVAELVSQAGKIHPALSLEEAIAFTCSSISAMYTIALNRAGHPNPDEATNSVVRQVFAIELVKSCHTREQAHLLVEEMFRRLDALEESGMTQADIAAAVEADRGGARSPSDKN